MRPPLPLLLLLLLPLAALAAPDACAPHAAHSRPAACELASSPPCAPRGARVPYTRLWFCAPRWAAPLLGVAGAAWVAALLALMAAVSAHFLVPAVEFIALALHVPPALAGVTLLAVAAGAPDLATEVAAVLSGGTPSGAAAPGGDDGGLAAAVAVGSSLAVLTLGLAAAGLAARGRGGATFPSAAAAARDGGAYFVATLALGAALWDGALSAAEAGGLLALYAAYVALAVAVGRHGGPLSGATGGDVAAALRAHSVGEGGGGPPLPPPAAFGAVGDVEMTGAVAVKVRRRGSTAAGDAAPAPLAPPPTPRGAVSADGATPRSSAPLSSGSSSARSSTGPLLPIVVTTTAAAATAAAPAPTPAGGGSARATVDGCASAASAASARAAARRRGRLAAAVHRVLADVESLVPSLARVPNPRARALLRALAAPPALLLHATMPCLAPNARLGPAHALLFSVATPAFTLAFLGAGPGAVGWPAFGGAWAAASAALAACLAPRFIASRGAPVPARTPLLAGLALAGAGAWLAAAADEAVDALRAAARAVGAPAELAAALLAVGGSIPELVAVAALAAAGPAGATAALHSAAAGPVFNLLVALPVPAALAALRGGTGPAAARALDLTLTNGVLLLLACTLAALALLGAALPLARWTVAPRFAAGLVALYGAVQIAFIAVEGGVWSAPAAPSARKAAREGGTGAAG